MVRGVYSPVDCGGGWRDVSLPVGRVPGPSAATAGRPCFWGAFWRKGMGAGGFLSDKGTAGIGTTGTTSPIGFINREGGRRPATQREGLPTRPPGVDAAPPPAIWETPLATQNYNNHRPPAARVRAQYRPNAWEKSDRHPGKTLRPPAVAPSIMWLVFSKER